MKCTKRKVQLSIETTSIGIIVLGTTKLTEEEILITTKMLDAELKHRKKVLHKNLEDMLRGK